MKIIVGLGNRGAQYEHTYHNLGFWAAEALAEIICSGATGGGFGKGGKGKIRWNKECDSQVFKARVDGRDILVAKPQTFMNRSGIAAAKLLKKYGAKNEDLIVICDDIDIQRGAFRYRKSGSAGTHNGLKSIIYDLDTTEFKRIRLGIGRPPEGQNLAEFVLSEIPSSERGEFLDLAKAAAAEALTISLNDCIKEK